jgi:uncharacterized membrane protein YciS (DUF1049 family)
MILILLVFALALSVVAIIFALQNSMVVQVAFFSYQAQGSLALFILLAVALGIVIGVLVMLPGFLKRTLAISGHRRKISELESRLGEQTPPPSPAEDVDSPEEKAVG